MHITINDEGQHVENYDSLTEYKEAHPEDFLPIIPISHGMGEMIITSDEIKIEELPFDDVVIHPHK